ncbi:MAG TPA: hypothetical protein VIU65_08395 [Pyrinomonadaceae bacterium]
MKSRFQFTASLAVLLALLTMTFGWATEASVPKLARYVVHDLGTLPGGTASYAFDLNDAGWVAGSSTLTPDGAYQHGVLWHDHHVTDLGTLGGPNSEAGGPNASLEAALIAETSKADPNGEDFCGFGTHLQCLAAIWRPAGNHPLRGALTALAPLPGGNNSQAYGLNNRSQVVGFAENGTFDSTCITPSQVRRFEAVIWGRNGRIRRLQPLAGDTVGFAFGINDEGEAVGGSGLCSNTLLPPIEPSAPHAVLWEEDGSPRDLGNLGGTFNLASAINNRGDVDGTAQVLDGNLHAFLWTRQTGMRDLGTLPGDFLSVAPCCDTVNDRREVVGISIPGPTGGGRAFIWQNGVMSDLNDLAPGSPLYLFAALAINSRSEIVGIGTTPTGEVHAFLAIPRNGADEDESVSPAEAVKTGDDHWAPIMPRLNSWRPTARREELKRQGEEN